MKFLLDQDVYAVTARLLEELGHDIALAGKLGLAQARDEALLQAAQQQGRILVTRDRDFGNLVFVRSLHVGVLYLRIRPSTETAVHHELKRALQEHPEEVLRRSFVVIEPGRHRIRRIGAP